MQRVVAIVLAMTFGGSLHAADDEHHSHPTPEKLGTVTFPTSCQAAVKPAFERALALLHSFAYTASALAFREGAEQIRRAIDMRAGSLRERQFIEALDTYYRDPDQEAAAARAEGYARAMADVARNNPRDAEAQIFYARSAASGSGAARVPNSPDVRAGPARSTGRCYRSCRTSG